MSGLVDLDAYKKAIQMPPTPKNDYWHFLVAYESAKQEKQKGSLPDWKHDTNCKHTADAKPALPELPKTTVIEGNDLEFSVSNLINKQNQLITCLQAVYKELQERK